MLKKKTRKNAQKTESRPHVWYSGILDELFTSSCAPDKFKKDAAHTMTLDGVTLWGHVYYVGTL